MGAGVVKYPIFRKTIFSQNNQAFPIPPIPWPPLLDILSTSQGALLASFGPGYPAGRISRYTPAQGTHAFLGGLHPIRRMGAVREVVEAVLYLESAAFVTGETLHVDGGAHAGHW